MLYQPRVLALEKKLKECAIRDGAKRNKLSMAIWFGLIFTKSDFQTLDDIESLIGHECANQWMGETLASTRLYTFDGENIEAV